MWDSKERYEIKIFLKIALLLILGVILGEYAMYRAFKSGFVVLFILCRIVLCIMELEDILKRHEDRIAKDDFWLRKEGSPVWIGPFKSTSAVANYLTKLRCEDPKDWNIMTTVRAFRNAEEENNGQRTGETTD